MNLERVEVGQQQIPDKLVVLTFDDALVNHATYVAPLLKRYDFGATFFICEFPAWKECPGFEDKEKYMTWEQIKMLHESGFEIGNHTLTHRDVSKLSKEELGKEIDEIEECFSLYGIPKSVSFCYPGYTTSPEALSVLEEKGFLWARTGGGTYDPQKHSPLLMPSVHAPLEKDLDSFSKMVGEAKNGAIVVVVFHGIPDQAHPWVSMEQDAFREYMEYLYNHNFTVISMRDVSKYISVPR